MKQKQSISIMISCPSDAQEEKEVIKKVIQEWNDNHFESSFYLQPRDWEANTYPEVSNEYKEGQEVINDQILKDVDILVAIFSNRLGSQTNQYPSGTVEEIMVFIDRGGKPMIYFNSSSKKVEFRKFKEEMKNKGLYGEYNSIENLREHFQDHLTRKIVRVTEGLQNNLEEDVVLKESASIKLCLNEDAIQILNEYKELGNFCCAIERENILFKNKWFNEPREKAELIGAINDLLEHQLIETENNFPYETSSFDLTKAGYDFLDGDQSTNTRENKYRQIVQQLGNKEQELLLKAEKANGKIRNNPFIGDKRESLFIGQESILKNQSSKEKAEWKSALQHLERLGYLLENDQQYTITSTGYSVIDLIKNTTTN